MICRKSNAFNVQSLATFENSDLAEEGIAYRGESITQQ